MTQKTNEILTKELNEKGILRLTLDDPGTKNPLSELMMDNLISEIDTASTDKEVKVIVIGSTGDVFCSGHDLKELKDCLLYTSPSPRDRTRSRMPSSA